MRDSSIYRTSLNNAWQFTWQYKQLWLFGILAVFLGQFGLGDFIGNLLNQTDIFSWPNFSLQMPDPTLKFLIYIAWAGLFLFGLGLSIVVASAISQGALISASSEWFLKGKVSSLSKLWKEGIKNFWPTLLINCTRRLLLLGLAFIFGYFWVNFGMNGGWINTTITIVILSLEIMLAMIISSISIYALAYSTIDKEKIFRAVKKGASLFSEHLLVSLELNLLLFFISLILIVIIFPLPTIFLVPSMLVWAFAGISGYAQLFSIGTILGWFLFLAAVALIGGIFNTFTTSAWIYVFMKMHHQGILSRILHHIGNIFKR